MNTWSLLLFGTAVFVKVTGFILVTGAVVYYGRKCIKSLVQKKKESSNFETSKNAFDTLVLKYDKGELSKDELVMKVKELAAHQNY